MAEVIGGDLDDIMGDCSTMGVPRRRHGRGAMDRASRPALWAIPGEPSRLRLWGGYGSARLPGAPIQLAKACPKSACRRSSGRHRRLAGVLTPALPEGREFPLELGLVPPLAGWRVKDWSCSIRPVLAGQHLVGLASCLRTAGLRIRALRPHCPGRSPGRKRQGRTTQGHGLFAPAR